MTPEDAARLLAVAATFDPRLRPPSPEDALARATAWSAALRSGMTLAWAQQAVVRHYADSTDALMPAHLNAAWKSYRRAEVEADEAAARAIPADAVPMPPGLRERFNALTGRP